MSGSLYCESIVNSPDVSYIFVDILIYTVPAFWVRELKTTLVLLLEFCDSVF
jgi:hypothetical protein